MKTLFVSDLDGTLMQPDATLSPVTVRLLNKAIDAGRLFSVATARTPATVVPIMERVNHHALAPGKGQQHRVLR